MAYYWKIRRLNSAHRKHVSKRLLELRDGLRKEVIDKKNVGELKIASWNLMHFGGGGGYTRSVESLQYIAEIIDHFDLVAIQEVKRDIRQLKLLVDDFLGDDWDFIVSDTTEGDAGNDERMAILYRKGKVWFGRIAGEIVLPKQRGIDNEPRQLARTPYYLGFQAGWFKFKLCTVHIHYGAKGGRDKQTRIAEIAYLAKFLKNRSNNERKWEVEFAKQNKWDTVPSAANYILLGDFNIHNTPDMAEKEALTKNGFKIPKDIDGSDTNTGKSGQPFDQIATRIMDARFEQGAGGVIDYRDYFYRDGAAESDLYRTFPKKHVKKLKEFEEKLPDRASEKLKEAQKKRQKAKTETADKAAKLLKQADKLEVVAAELKDIFDDEQQRRIYISKEVNTYFERFYRKNQISDHLLIWTSFKIDYADDYLEELSI